VLPAEDMLAQRQRAHHQLAHRHERKAQGSLCCVRVRGLQNTVDIIDGALARSA
jgi:hypothetical protein